MWGGLVNGSKNNSRGKFIWIKDYLGQGEEPPTYLFDKFRPSCAVLRTLYRRLKNDLFQHFPLEWKRKWIGGKIPGKLTDAKMLNYLQMLSSGNSFDMNYAVSYISAGTGGQYFFQCFKVIIEIDRETYMRRWPTENEFVDILYLLVEKKHKRKWVSDCVGSIDCSKLFLENCPMQTRDGIWIAKTEV